MLKNIFVGNVPFQTTEDDIRDLFEARGEVQTCKLILDRETGRSRGFAFVEMESEDADRAIEELDGHAIDGRNLRVNEAEARPRRGGSGGGGGGGGGGGSGGPRDRGGPPRRRPW